MAAAAADLGWTCIAAVAVAEAVAEVVAAAALG